MKFDPEHGFLTRLSVNPIKKRFNDEYWYGVDEASRCPEGSRARADIELFCRAGSSFIM